MITFISATPGGGKTLTAVEILYKISKDNIKNLNFNYYLFKATMDKFIELGLQDELRHATIIRGQGLEQQTVLLFFGDTYFDFLSKEYFLNVVLEDEYKELIVNYPTYYFERVLYLNSIIERVNKEHNLKFQKFKFVRPIYTNINGLLLSQARSLPYNNDWRQTPFGSVLIYDEAQLIEIFNEETKKVDPIVRDLTIHRHKFYDIYFISQDPALVHRYIRKLCSHHIHLINAFGFEQSIRLEWSICQEQPNALRNIARSEVNKLYRFPKVLYRVYISTTASTRVKRYPWKKFALIGGLGAIGIYGASGLFSSNNALVSFATGGKYGNETTKKDDKTATHPDKQQASSSPVAETKANETAKSPDQMGSASEPVANSSNVAEYKVSYDVSNPYAYEPPNTATVVNNRVFSGCFCDSKGFCKAYDQQGITIRGISQSVCKDVIKESGNRPFNYFRDGGVTNAHINNQVNTSDNIQQTSQRSVPQEVTQANNYVEPHLQARTVTGANAL